MPSDSTIAYAALGLVNQLLDALTDQGTLTLEAKYDVYRRTIMRMESGTSNLAPDAIQLIRDISPAAAGIKAT